MGKKSIVSKNYNKLFTSFLAINERKEIINVMNRE